MAVTIEATMLRPLVLQPVLVHLPVHQLAREHLLVHQQVPVHPLVHQQVPVHPLTDHELPPSLPIVPLPEVVHQHARQLSHHPIITEHHRVTGAAPIVVPGEVEATVAELQEEEEAIAEAQEEVAEEEGDRGLSIKIQNACLFKRQIRCAHLSYADVCTISFFK